MIIDVIKSNSRVAGISSDEVALAKSLVDNKCKNKELFVCEGLWAVDKLIEKNIEVDYFFYNSDKLENNQMSEMELNKVNKMASYAHNTFAISEKACRKISDRDGFDEFFIVAELPRYSLEEIKALIGNKKDVSAIVMDGLEQPGNIGAILRSFDASGGDIAFIVNKKARLNNSRLVRSSLGASFMLPVVEAEIEEVQEWLKENDFKCLVTDLQAKKSFREADCNGRIAIIAGNEHTGISNSWRTLPNSESIIIPMMGSVESLNVGFSVTLIAYDLNLRRMENRNRHEQ